MSPSSPRILLAEERQTPSDRTVLNIRSLLAGEAPLVCVLFWLRSRAGSFAPALDQLIARCAEHVGLCFDRRRQMENIEGASAHALIPTGVRSVNLFPRSTWRAHERRKQIGDASNEGSAQFQSGVSRRRIGLDLRPR